MTTLFDRLDELFSPLDDERRAAVFAAIFTIHEYGCHTCDELGHLEDCDERRWMNQELHRMIAHGHARSGMICEDADASGESDPCEGAIAELHGEWRCEKHLAQYLERLDTAELSESD